MARFARDCLHIMNQLTKKLEVTLGPDTADLRMRAVRWAKLVVWSLFSRRNLTHLSCHARCVSRDCTAVP
jgi:hypothetical protein